MTKPITLNRRTVLAGATAAGALSLAPGMTLAKLRRWALTPAPGSLERRRREPGAGVTTPGWGMIKLTPGSDPG